MTRPVWVLPAAVLVFALASVLWFGLGFAITAQLIADGSMRDRAHVVIGCANAVAEIAVVAGWLWALIASARMGALVNGPVQLMCSATAAAQLAAMLSMIALMGGWTWDEPAGFLIGYAAVATILAVLINRSRTEQAVDDAG